MATHKSIPKSDLVHDDKVIRGQCEINILPDGRIYVHGLLDSIREVLESLKFGTANLSSIDNTGSLLNVKTMDE
jgi:hypothetical protein